MAYGGKISLPLGLSLMVAGALGLLLVAWTMRVDDVRREASCESLGVVLPTDGATVAVTSPKQVLRVNRQVCVWWRPGKYFADELVTQARLNLALATALQDEETARRALDEALAAYGPDVATKRAQLDARVEIRQKVEADIAALAKPKEVAFYLDSEEAPVSFWAKVTADNNWQLVSRKLAVPHNAEGDIAKNWRRLLGVDGAGSRDVQLGLGDVGGHAPRAAVGPGKLKLDVYTPLGLFAGLASLAALTAGVILAGWNTAMLRDRKPTLGDPNPPFSLGRSQLALWFMLSLGGFLFVWLVSGQFVGVFTNSMVALLTVSAVTSVGGLAVDVAHDNAARTAAANARVAGLPAPVAPVRSSNGFFRDIISDGDGDVALHRVQVLAWTVLLAMFFVLHVWRTYAFPDFDNALLALATLTSAIYVALKIPEKP